MKGPSQQVLNEPNRTRIAIRLDVLAAGAFIGMAVIGCARPEYRYGVDNQSPTALESPLYRDITTGGDHPRLDKIENAIRAPGRKLVKWFGKEKKDEPNYDQKLDDATHYAVQYLNDHGIENIYIDVRRYEPGEQWRRLRANDGINPLFKYTDGSLSVLVSTIFPARVFHSDKYNPYTNTLSINSSDRADAIHQAASAKQFAASRFPGIKAFSQGLPIIPVIHESRVASDVLSYTRAMDDWEFEKQLYPKSYAHIGGGLVSQSYGLTAAASADSFLVGPALSLAGGGVGYGVGLIVVSKREKENAQTQTASDVELDSPIQPASYTTALEAEGHD
jgi:hypothetical protein